MGIVFDKARYFNRKLAFSIFVIAVSTFNYGFDNQAFATTQAMEAFTRRFGKYDESTGSYAIDSQWLALFNSLNYIGFAAGMLYSTLNTKECLITRSYLQVFSSVVSSQHALDGVGVCSS